MGKGKDKNSSAPGKKDEKTNLLMKTAADASQAWPKVEFEYRDIKIAGQVIPQNAWMGVKTAANPWAFLRLLSPLPPGDVSVRYFQCILDAGNGNPCGHVFKIPDICDMAGQQSNIKDHVQKHFERTQIRLASDEKTNQEAVARRQQDLVTVILKSGLAYNKFTSAGPLKSYLKDSSGVEISPKTFRLRMREFGENAAVNIFDALKGNFLHVMSDSSPSKARENLVDTCVSFITADGEFQALPIALYNMRGQSSKSEYELLLLDTLEAYEISRSSTLYDGGRAVLVSATSDAGPGQSTVFRDWLSCERTSLDIAHGLNNLVKDVYRHEESLKAEWTKALAVCKMLRSSTAWNEKRQSLKITKPPNHRNIRWNSHQAITRYVVENQVALNKASAEMQLTRPDYEYLAMCEGMLKSISLLITRSQYVGPGDCVVLVMNLCEVMSDLLDNNFEYTIVENGSLKAMKFDPDAKNASLLQRIRFSRLSDGRNIALYRLFRRFFNDESYRQEELKDQIGGKHLCRKANYLRNLYVLAALRMSPYYNFDGGFVHLFGEIKCAQLRQRAADALVRLHRLADPAFFGRVESVEASVKRSRFSAALVDDEQPTGARPEDRHELEVLNFAKAIKPAFREFDPDDRNKGSYSQQRQKLFEGVKEQTKLPYHFTLVRLLWGITLTSVICEKDFATIQSILTPHRLRTGIYSLAAYFFSIRAPAWVTSDNRQAKKPQPKKITDFFSVGRIAGEKLKLSEAASTVSDVAKGEKLKGSEATIVSDVVVVDGNTVGRQEDQPNVVVVVDEERNDDDSDGTESSVDDEDSTSNKVPEVVESVNRVNADLRAENVVESRTRSGKGFLQAIVVRRSYRKADRMAAVAADDKDKEANNEDDSDRDSEEVDTGESDEECEDDESESE
jgi:hypothetical protein